VGDNAERMLFALDTSFVMSISGVVGTILEIVFLELDTSFVMSISGVVGTILEITEVAELSKGDMSTEPVNSEPVWSISGRIVAISFVASLMSLEMSTDGLANENTDINARLCFIMELRLKLGGRGELGGGGLGDGRVGSGCDSFS
jgi:hypothetical protein